MIPYFYSFSSVVILFSTSGTIGELKTTFIEIDLPESKNKKTSIWVNDKVWEDFKSFNKKHKEFSNADLISMALKSYMEKYEGI